MLVDVSYLHCDLCNGHDRYEEGWEAEGPGAALVAVSRLAVRVEKVFPVPVVGQGLVGHCRHDLVHNGVDGR